MTAPDGRVTRKSRGTTATYASLLDSQNRRSSPLRPYTSSYAAHFAGRPAPGSRFSWAMASCGFAWCPSPPGIRAALRRRQSFSQRPGMKISKSAQACLDVVTHAENTVVTQFSACPVHPACRGAAHAVASPSLSWAVSSIAIPGPIRSPGLQGSHARARAGNSARSCLQSRRKERSRACIRYGLSCPAASARAQQFAFTPGASSRT